MENDNDNENEAKAEAETQDEEYFFGDKCPVCSVFNSPPALSTCKHFVGSVWDGQFDAQPCLKKLKELHSTASDLFEELDDKVKKSFLKSLNSRIPLEKILLTHVNYDYSFGDFLITTMPVESGDGWSTGGMLSGFGYNFYMENTDSIQQAETCLQKFIDEFSAP